MNPDYERAQEFAIIKHRSVNQFYGGEEKLPYDYHLEKVFNVGQRFIHLISKEKVDIVLSACWLHDIIEDARQTYNDIREQFGKEIAEIVYSVTDEKGRNRKERKNTKFWHELRQNRFAIFVKLCDYIANSEYSKQTGSKMFEIYKKGYHTLWEEVYTTEYKEMFHYLEQLFEDIKLT